MSPDEGPGADGRPGPDEDPGADDPSGADGAHGKGPGSAGGAGDAARGAARGTDLRATGGAASGHGTGASDPGPAAAGDRKTSDAPSRGGVPLTPEDADFAPVDDWAPAGSLRAVHAYPVDPEGRLLLQLRDDRPGVVWPGTWAAFGGGVEPGETLRAAIARETSEELGIEPPDHAFRPFARALSDLPGRRRVYAFALDWVWPVSAIRLAEGAGFGFFTQAQLAALPMPTHGRRLTDAWIAARGGGER